jgi:hypothetical protein
MPGSVKTRNSILISVLLFSSALSALAASPFSLDIDIEYGFTSILSHEIQSGKDSDKGDVFDYRSSGNQNVLFPFSRYQVDLEIREKHHAVFLYQPLLLETESTIDEEFRYDRIDFTPADGVLELIYSFGFWRFSYLYDAIEAPGFFISPGVSLQIRNATISFKSADGSKSSVNSGIGPVPVLKLRTGYQWDSGIFVLFDGDAFYASNRFLNGADYSFTGYIYDLALKGGYGINDYLSASLGFRFLGGGAEGTDDKDDYTYNDLHTFNAMLGMTLHL